MTVPMTRRRMITFSGFKFPNGTLFLNQQCEEPGSMGTLLTDENLVYLLKANYIRNHWSGLYYWEQRLRWRGKEKGTETHIYFLKKLTGNQTPITLPHPPTQTIALNVKDPRWWFSTMYEKVTHNSASGVSAIFLHKSFRLF